MSRLPSGRDAGRHFVLLKERQRHASARLGASLRKQATYLDGKIDLMWRLKRCVAFCRLPEAPPPAYVPLLIWELLPALPTTEDRQPAPDDDLALSLHAAPRAPGACLTTAVGRAATA